MSERADLDAYLSRLKGEIDADFYRVQEITNRLAEADCDSRDHIKRLWREHYERVAPLYGELLGISHSAVDILPPPTMVVPKAP